MSAAFCHTNKCQAGCSKSGGGASDSSSKRTSGPHGSGAKDKVVMALYAVRNPLAEYQESAGIRKDESLSFLLLLKMLIISAYTAACNLIMILYSMVPVFDSLLCIIRFYLDKIIYIANSESKAQTIIHIVIFLAQQVIIFSLSFLIVTVIVLPVYHVVLFWVSKTMVIFG